VTVICPLANSYLQSAGAVAELAATRKVAKYSALEDQYIFQPIAVESLGPMNWEARKFLADTSVGRFRVCLETTGKLRFCFNAFVLLFRFNSVLLHTSFELDDRRSSAGQGKFAGQRPTFYHCVTQPTNLYVTLAKLEN